ncbi:MAG: hypothetical protein FWJ62_00115 [Thermaerobacter sp.]|nr:hypothetical protein [Bacillota bacterium]REJ37816.1 MAG: hypothetical protein DIU84_03195 [Bacillota bacterium]
MKPVDFGVNLSQVHEVARLHRAGDHLDEQGRRAQAEDALREAMRRREQVERSAESRHGRVDRDARGGGGDAAPGSGGRKGAGPQRRPHDGGQAGGHDPPPGDDGDPRGRVLDVRV